MRDNSAARRPLWLPAFPMFYLCLKIESQKSTRFYCYSREFAWGIFFPVCPYSAIVSKSSLKFWGLVGVLALPLVAVLAVGYLPAVITSNEDFFTVTINGTPAIDVDAWTLTVGGHVDHPLIFTYDNLTAQTNTTVVAKLQCVDGPSGTAEWKGVRLSDILNIAGEKPGTVDIVFYCADGYSTSLAYPNEIGSDVILAHTMNGVPLPADQGFPVRIVAPNELGYKWAKWITRIDVVIYDFKGYWESRGWADDASVATPSDWRFHALLFSLALLVGGLAAISGVKLSPTMTSFRDFPRFIGRKFHIISSLAFLGSSISAFLYWITATMAVRGHLFYTLHGIVGMVSIALILIGAIGAFPALRRSAGKRDWHGKVSLSGFGIFLVTILLGFALTAGFEFLSRFLQ